VRRTALVELKKVQAAVLRRRKPVSALEFEVVVPLMVRGSGDQVASAEMISLMA
jgi:hypothetical protein